MPGLLPIFEEVEDQIFRIEVPLPASPLRYLNAYLLRATPERPGWRGRSLLIDNGFNHPQCAEALFSALKVLGVALNTLDFFVTHLHADHSGLSSRLLEQAGPEAWIYASPGDGTHINMLCRQSFRLETHLSRMLAFGMPAELMRHMLQGHPGLAWATDRPCPFTPALPDDIFRYAGYNLRVLSMPGHTPDLLCLYEAQKRILFSSDHILGDISPHIAPLGGGNRDALGNYLRSLRKAAKLDVRLCLPGHRTILADCRGRIAALERHHTTRLEEVRGILDREGECNAWQVASRMQWSIRARNWDDFPEAQQWFACGEAQSHLEYLHTCGQASKRRHGGLKLYKSTG